MKSQLITWIATQPDDSPDLVRVDAIRRGAVGVESKEALHTLAEIGKEVRKHPTWLHKLEIQKHCGERMGGRLMYRVSSVVAYLQSPLCQARIRELHAARKARETSKGAA